MKSINATQKNIATELAILRRELVGIDDNCIPAETVERLRKLVMCHDSNIFSTHSVEECVA